MWVSSATESFLVSSTCPLALFQSIRDGKLKAALKEIAQGSQALAVLHIGEHE